MKNHYEHFLKLQGQDSVGAVGTIEQVNPAMKQVEEFHALIFDLDAKIFQEGFKPSRRAFVNSVLPELELRQTSASENWHGILHLKTPLQIDEAGKLHEVVARMTLAAPSGSLTMAAGETFLFDSAAVEKVLQQRARAQAKKLRNLQRNAEEPRDDTP